MDDLAPDRHGVEDSLARARAAFDHGWSIIPVRLDKRPALRTWKEFQSRQAQSLRSGSGENLRRGVLLRVAKAA